jgi:hypothetical protein
MTNDQVKESALVLDATCLSHFARAERVFAVAEARTAIAISDDRNAVRVARTVRRQRPRDNLDVRWSLPGGQAP